MTGFAVQFGMRRAEGKGRIPFMGKLIGGPLCRRRMASFALRLSVLTELAAMQILMTSRAIGRGRSVLNDLLFALRCRMALDAARICMALAVEESAHILMNVGFYLEGGKIRPMAGRAVVFKYFLFELTIMRVGVADLARYRRVFKLAHIGLRINRVALYAGDGPMGTEQRI